MHCAFVVNHYPPHVGGVESHVFALANELTRTGVTVTVVTLADRPSDTFEDDVRVIRLKRRLPIAGVIGFAPWSALRTLSRQFADTSVSVISTHTRFFPLSFLGSRLAKRLGIPLIHTEHGSGFVKGVSAPIAIASRIVDVTIGRWVLRRADLVLAVSDRVAHFVLDLAKVTAREFPAAIGLAPWTDARSLDRDARFVFLGRIVEGKGWDTLLDAVDMLRSDPSTPQFTVDIVGSGPLDTELKKRVERLGASAGVTIHGRLEGNALRAVLRRATLVNPTTLSEGFQTTLLESLAIGGQVVTFDVPGASALQRDGAPLLITDAPTVEALARGMRIMLTKPRAAYPLERLGQWSWEHRALEFLDIASTLVDSTSHTTAALENRIPDSHE